jgi:mannose-6-phosphate isomerase-like protein (cupin superfamily)
MIKKSHQAAKKIPYRPSGDKVESVSYQTLATGEKMMVTTMFYDKDAVVQQHSHPHEQAGYVVSGIVVIDISGIQTTLEPGDSYVIPGKSLPHSGCVLAAKRKISRLKGGQPHAEQTDSTASLFACFYPGYDSPAFHIPRIKDDLFSMELSGAYSVVTGAGH